MTAATGKSDRSDRGSQYCSHAFQDAPTECGMQSSMSRKGSCRDNAPDEVIDWLTCCNHKRLHSTLSYVSPMQFEENWFAEQLKKAA